MIEDRPKQVIIGRVLKTKAEKYVYLYKYRLKDMITYMYIYKIQRLRFHLCVETYNSLVFTEYYSYTDLTK